jgi:Sec-independent protein translocase protein TatA
MDNSPFDYKAWEFWFEVGQFLFIGVVSLVVFAANKQKANSTSIVNLDKELKKEINEIDDQLIRVQTEVKHLPDHDDFGNVHRRIDELAQCVKKMEGQTGQINANVKLLTEHLLNKGS